jgi:hypothetical protein
VGEAESRTEGVKIHCPKCGNIVANLAARDGLYVLTIKTWRRNSYIIAGTVEQLTAVRIQAECGMETCGAVWDITAAIQHKHSAGGAPVLVAGGDAKQTGLESLKEKINV